MRASRRRFLVGGSALAALAACGSPPTTHTAPTTPLPPIDERIAELEQRFDAFAGVYAVDLDSDRFVAHRADDPFAMCSTFKGYASARILQLTAAGEIKLSDLVAVKAADILPNSPITETHVGGMMSLAELCQAALQRSDNAAANYLLRTIGGPGAVTAFARSIGDDVTRLDRWETELNSALPGDPRDTSTPRALGTGYRKLLSGDALPAPQRQQLEDWMRGNQTSSLRPGLPPGWTSADKTGSGDFASTNDVGIGYGPAGQRMLLSFMTRTRADDAKAPDLRPLITELTTLVLPYLKA
jgi:beta-lactamase class A